MKKRYSLLIGTIISFFLLYGGAQYASTSTQGSRPIIDNYEGYEKYKDNDNLAVLLIENSTDELKEDYVYYISEAIKGCKESMDYVGGRLTRIEVVNDKVLSSFELYMNDHCN